LQTGPTSLCFAKFVKFAKYVADPPPVYNQAMQYGITFPQNEIGTDPIAVRDFAQAVEGAGFDYMIAFDHVTGAHPDRFKGHDLGFTTPPYLYKDEFHEPFVLFSYLAGLTTTLQFATSILILPQRQTALVAKQAAALDILSGGRFRLGIGVGWNFTEYEALSQDFHTRGRRQEEQVIVMRKLWTEPLVTFQGRWHKLDNVGIAPLPSRPIPVWFGGGANDALLRRIARLADGWIPGLNTSDDFEAVMARVHGYMREYGRDPATLGLQGHVHAASGGPADWVGSAKRWQALGATHLGLGGAPQGSKPSELLAAAIMVKGVVEGELGQAGERWPR
jgi:probable F420-dependent oxidoreductase